jgi:hypothetical protein
MDPDSGHLTVKMSGHPPFGAQVIANGHEWVACQAQTAGIGFTKEGNCFTAVADPQALAQVADTLSQPATIGHLSQVCDRWIYTACLCFGLDLDEQARSGFRYAYSVYQAEYSRNLLFGSGAQMDRVFNTLVDRTRSRLDVPMLRTLFGAKRRPGLGGSADLSPRLAAVIETPRWDLTLFKVHFGLLTLKGYTKGEHVLRFEAVVHNTKQLGCGRAIEKFPEIVTQLKGMAERFCTALDCVTTGFLPDGTLDALPLPSRIGRTRIGGIDLNKATDPGCAGGGPGVCRRTRRLHRRRPGRQGAGDGRPDRLHDPPGRLRPAQAPRQRPARQTRPVTALPGPPTRRPHHRRPAHPPRPGHRPHPGRCPQPPTRPQARTLDCRRPRLRDLAHRHADPLRRPRHRSWQLRCGPALLVQALVDRDRHGALRSEVVVGEPFESLERLGSRADEGEALGERVQDVAAREGGCLRGEAVRAGEPVQQGGRIVVGSCPSLGAAATHGCCKLGRADAVLGKAAGAHW